MKFLYTYLAITLSVLAAGIAFADYHYVATNGAHSSPFTNWTQAATNIQDAVNVAVDFDTVLISNGTYYSSGPVTNVPAVASNSMVVITNGIVMQGCNGAAVTFVNGNFPYYSNRVFYMSHTGAVLDSLTVMNGTNSSAGAGVYMSNGLVQNCIIMSNTVYGNGGGIYCIGGSLITNSIIRNNRGVNGGGIYCAAGGTVNGCTINSNTAWVGSQWGGGIYCAPGAAAQNCMLQGNRAYAGGGIFCQGASTVACCTIVENYGIAFGGGIFFWGSSGAVIRNCLIYRNYAGSSGGGGVHFYAGIGGTLQNCTVVSNTTSTNGGGVYVSTNINTFLINTIIYSNAAGGSGPNYYNVGEGSVSYTNCYSFTCTTPDLGGGVGNITNNPQFMDFYGNNYRLKGGSPCINTGTNESWMTNAYDLDGNTRIMYGIVDMGAYERVYEGNIYRVK